MNWHIPAKVIGNFGVSFLTPLTSGTIAESIYHIGLSFEETIVVAFIAALLYTGLSISRELVSYGEQKWKRE